MKWWFVILAIKSQFTIDFLLVYKEYHDCIMLLLIRVHPLIPHPHLQSVQFSLGGGGGGAHKYLRLE